MTKMTHFKYILTTLLVAVTAIAATAQKLQVVDTDGQPVAFVAVTSDSGTLIGTTDTEGWLADAKGAATLHLSHVAYKSKTVALADVADGKITIEELSFDLPEVTVKPKELAYVQTYFRLVYVNDDGPVYYRAGVIDNTYEIATKKVQSKARSLSRGRSGFIRFLLSTIIGRYIDRWGQLQPQTYYKKIKDYALKGDLTLSEEPSGRVVVSDTVARLGYIDTDLTGGQRTTAFNAVAFRRHKEQAEEQAKREAAIAAGKKVKEKKRKQRNDDEENNFYEVYRIDQDGNSAITDFVMRQFQTQGTSERSGNKYTIILESYATDRNYIDKKDYKQLRKDNEVDMEHEELLRFEQAHHIPPLPANLQEQVDRLFQKDKK